MNEIHLVARIVVDGRQGMELTTRLPDTIFDSYKEELKMETYREINQLRDENAYLKRELDRARHEADSLEDRLSKLVSRNFWQRIRNTK